MTYFPRDPAGNAGKDSSVKVPNFLAKIKWYLYGKDFWKEWKSVQNAYGDKDFGGFHNYNKSYLEKVQFLTNFGLILAKN